MNLDDATGMRKLDRSDMAGSIYALPEQIAKAEKLADDLDWPSINFEPQNIVLLGTGGGSAIAALLARSLFEFELRLPLTLNSGSRLPGWVNRNSLVIAATASGETEETLAALTEALEREACCLAVTGGGRLKSIAEERKLPLYLFDAAGMQARSAIGYLFTPIARTLARLGLSRDLRNQIQETIKLLTELRDRYGLENPEADNPAKQIARKLYGRFPIVYASDQLTYAAAIRWKNQLSENGKMLAHYNTFPELNHDEIVGYENFALRSHIQVVYLYDDAGDEPAIKQRMTATRSLIESAGGKVIDVCAEGQSDLARLFSLLYLGDWVSVYAALLADIDPTPVRSIVEMKRLLREHHA